MPPVVIDIRLAEDGRDVVHRAVQALVEGKLVAFPTETVYGLAAHVLNEEAVGRMHEIKMRDGKPFALAVRSLHEALDYVPHLSPLGRRLARRCWPGPITLVFNDAHPDSLLCQLPESVRRSVSPHGTVGFRVPAHPLILDVMKMLAGPLALTSANRRGDPEPVTAAEVVQSLGNDVALVLDDGRSRLGQSSSVVRVRDNEYEILREGVISGSTLSRLASVMLLFVCTGNTCRSPMAEVLAKRILADRLKCTADELDDRGVIISSAGVSAVAGARPSPDAVAVVQEIGADLTGHASQPVTDSLVRDADWIFAMTRAHREVIVRQWPDAAERTLLLRPDNQDIADPIGGAREDYWDAARQIQAALEARLAQLEF